jgi:hypothetical protein
LITIEPVLADSLTVAEIEATEFGKAVEGMLSNGSGSTIPVRALRGRFTRPLRCVTL